MRNKRRSSQWKKAGARFPNTLERLVVNLKKVMAKLRKQLKTAGPTLDTQISEHSRIEIGPVRLTDSGLDWLEKTHMRLAIGEPEKGSSRVRLATWSDYLSFIQGGNICGHL